MTNPIDKFFALRPIPENMAWRGAAYTQAGNFGDFARILDLDLETQVKVIGSHRSKSITLPVVQYELLNGSSVIIRHNFHDHALSVQSVEPVDPKILECVWADKEPTHPVLCEGFPEELVFGSYIDNAHEFTTHLPNDPGTVRVLLNHIKMINSRPGFTPLSAVAAKYVVK